MNDTQALETDLIGAICREQSVIRVAARYLEPEDFSIAACGVVFEAARDADSRRKLFDGYTAADALKGKIDDPRRFIAECMEVCVTTATVEEHAKLLRREADERRLRDKIQLALMEESGEKLTDTIAGICVEQIQKRRGGRMKKFEDVLRKTFNELFEEPKNRVDTGYGRLDGILQGMWGEELIILAARPAVGKSALAMNIAENAARSGKTVLFHSLEMGDTMIGKRALVRWTNRVTMSDLINRGFGKDETMDAEVANAYVRSAGLPIYLDDSANVKPSKVRAQAMTLRDLGLIVIDYGGLMAADRKAETRNLELGAISRDLKNLAKELQIPIIMLAQLSRKVGGDDVRPTLTDLRDSGELEQNADKCIFMWNIDREAGKIGVSVAKNRSGKQGDVVMYFDGEHMRYTETEERYDADEQKSAKKRGKRGNVYYDDDGLPVD